MRKVTILLVVLMAVVLVSCKDQKHRALQKEIEKVNAQCPIKWVFGEISNVALEGNTIVYHIDVKTQLLQLDKLKSNIDAVKESVLFDIVSNAEGCKAIIASNCDLKYIYKRGDETMTVVVKADELKKASMMLNNPEEVARRRLEMMVTTTRLQMPMQVDEVTILKDMFIEGNKVCYVYDIDNNVLTSDEMRNDIDGLKEGIVGSLSINDASVRSFLNAIVDNKMNLSYRYEFPAEKETVQVDFGIDELKEIAGK